jgi:hypothetical protein
VELSQQLLAATSPVLEIGTEVRVTRQHVRGTELLQEHGPMECLTGGRADAPEDQRAPLGGELRPCSGTSEASRFESDSISTDPGGWTDVRARKVIEAGGMGNRNESKPPRRTGTVTECCGCRFCVRGVGCRADRTGSSRTAKGRRHDGSRA